MNISIKDMGKWMLFMGVFILFCFTSACKDEAPAGGTEGDAGDSPVAETALEQMNRDLADMQQLAEGQLKIKTYTEENSGHCLLSLENGHVLTVYSEPELVTKSSVPVVGIDADGYWVYELDGRTENLLDTDGQPVPALSLTGKKVLTPQFRVGAKKFWEVSYDGANWSKIGIRQVWDTEKEAFAVFSPFAGYVVDESAMTLTLSLRCGETLITAPVEELSGVKLADAWKKFIAGSTENVLLDYSYAGYDHGESVPADGRALGYTEYNVREYMEKYDLSARDAFIKIIADKGLLGSNELAGESGWANRGKEANMVIYFPEGTYVLHSDEDNKYVSSGQKDALDSKGNNVSTAIRICASNLIIKGDGVGKTFIKMETPNLPTDVKNTGSSPEMINIGHTNSLNQSGLSESRVAVKAEKGKYQVTVDNASWITADKWIQLRVRSNAADLIAGELGPITPKSTWAIMQAPLGDTADEFGVKITEIHQVKSVSGNTITFYEPIMHEVDPTYGWVVRDYKYLQNVGVEDLTFVGDALDNYSHHGDGSGNKDKYGWQYDGAYKPLVLTRVVNSWVRNVNFTSVSEALSINESANCSAYKIDIDGIRGHSAVRAQHSSRVFIGAVRDMSTGNDNTGKPCNGQFHGCGVSKPSIGCVIWNSTWGSDACFESHATQPRATLFDNCSGGLVYYRAGGAENEAPNHLADLTIWNLNVTGTDDHASNFAWWSNSDTWWKIYPPIVVGTYGQKVQFTKDANQLTYEESTGVKVTPESLYEAQLEKRLGSVPDWLNALK